MNVPTAHEPTAHVPPAAARIVPTTTADARGCADCAEHAAMAFTCVPAPAVPAALPGPPTEDLRPAAATIAGASPAGNPADPRPPNLSALCISRR